MQQSNIDIDAYLDAHKKYGNSPNNPYVKMAPIMNDIFKLYDYLELNMGKYYKEKNPMGKFGLTKGVSISKDNKQYYSKFEHKKMEYFSPTGFIYPILGAFRALLKEENGVYVWQKNPFIVANDLGAELVDTTVERSRTLGNNPQSVGKDTGNWKTLYMTIRLGLID